MINSYLIFLLDNFVKFIVPKENKFIILENNSQVEKIYKQRKLYDYIIINKIIEKSSDIQTNLEKIYTCLNYNGRLIIIYENYSQSFLTGLINAFISNKKSNKNWLSTNDIKTFVTLTDFDIVTQKPLCLMPIQIPIISWLFNFLIIDFFPFNHLARYQYMIVRKIDINPKDVTTSIIIPAKNEAGNIKTLFNEIPVIGKSTEIIFIVGKSADDTYNEIRKYINKTNVESPIQYRLIKQSGTGKADALKQGFSQSKGEALFILDADLSIQPADLKKFYYALISYKGDLINGSRLIYPIKENAMQFINILGNKFFSLFFSWILGQNIKDTLCGTKVFWRSDYVKMIKDNSFFGKYDPFGDFDLLLAAGKMNLKIIDLPVQYYERTYGSTNIRRFKNAWQLTIHSIIAMRTLKFRTYK